MDALAPLIKSLNAEGRLRVWSLVITVFGDAVQHRGGRIATMRLQQLLGRIGVEPGAVRTALSRLTNDGWLVRERKGRNSFYHLSQYGQGEVTAASHQIYAAPLVQKVTKWVLASGATAPDRAIPMAANLWLIPAECAPELPDHICVCGMLTSFPQSFAKQALSDAHQNALAILQHDIDALQGLALTPLDAMAARILLIHRWRRIVLRFPDIPPELFLDNASNNNLRAQVAKAYGTLIEMSETWLDSPAPSLAPMPTSAALTTHRFHS